MRKLYIFGLIGLAAVIIGLAWADQMTFTTYYPAPYGVYNNMVVMNSLGVGTTEPSRPLHVEGVARADTVLLNPLDPADVDTPEDGMLVCDKNDANTIKRYDASDSKWKPIPGFGPPDFDSGWVEMGVPPPPLYNYSRTLNFATDNAFGLRDITGKDPGKFFVSLKIDSTGAPHEGGHDGIDECSGINNWGFGGNWDVEGWKGGFYYNHLTSNSITINETAVETAEELVYDRYKKARVYIWCWE